MKQNGLMSLAGEQGGSPSTAPVESEERTSNENREREREPDAMAIDEASENQQDKAVDDSAAAT
jgi:hypothetical protein